jgi:transcriptional regulator with XRE-family HTH domain
MLDATIRLGLAVRDLRTALGWRQRTLADKAGVSQPWISEIERGRCPDVSIETIDRLLRAMGAQLVIDVTSPFLANPRQRDVVHARCSSFVARRLERLGWSVETEVEVGGDRSRGWIDVLAWHPTTGLLLVIEIKTELHDVGAIERTIGWYEREAWAAARRLGWRPRRVLGCLVVLSTDVVDQRIRDNRSLLDRGFPIRAKALTEIVSQGDASSSSRGRALALIDPRSQRRVWLRPSRLDGRRTRSPYADYADFIRLDGASRGSRSRSPISSGGTEHDRPSIRTVGRRFARPATLI